MSDGWEATLLDMTPVALRHAPPGRAETGGLDKDLPLLDTGGPGNDVLRETGDAGFDPNAIIGTGQKLLGGASAAAGGSRTTAGRVLGQIASVGGDMAAGAAIGGTVGSVFPGIGTVIGGAAGAAAGLIGGLVSLFSHHHHHHAQVHHDPVADKLHALAERHPRQYGADLIIYLHDPARYHALERAHELPSERWRRRMAEGGIDHWLRRTHMSQGADLAARFAGRPLAERVLLGYAAATDSLQDVEQALDGLGQGPQTPARATFQQLVAGMTSPQIARVSAAFGAGADSAVETYRAVLRERADAQTSARARILRALTAEWAKGSPASVALFERLARAYSPDQAQALRRALEAGDAGPIFRKIEEANRMARDGQMAAALERYAIEWFAHKADAHPDTPAAETPLREPQNVDAMPLRQAREPAREAPPDDLAALLTRDGPDDDGDDQGLDTGDVLAFSPMAPGGWVPTRWEERDGWRRWGRGMAVPSFEVLTEGFEPTHLARLHEAIERGNGLPIYRRILEETMGRARAARERHFLAELRRIGCVPGQVCAIPADRLAGFAPIWASYSPDQVVRLRNALLAGAEDPVMVFRDLERESYEDRLRRMHEGWSQYLAQWNTAGAPNPAGLANYANVVTEQILGRDTSGLLSDIGGAISSLFKGGDGAAVAKQALGAATSIAHGASPLAQIENLGKTALGSLSGAASGHRPLPVAPRHAPPPLARAALGTKVHEVHPAPGLPPLPAPGLPAPGLGDLAAAPEQLMALLPPSLGLAKDAVPSSWWEHLTRGQGLETSGIEELWEGVRRMESPLAIPQLVERYRFALQERLRRLARERERVFAELVQAMRQRYGAAFDPWALGEGQTPLFVLMQRMDPAQIARLRDAFVSGADPIETFRDIERENHEEHAAAGAAYFKRYLGSLGETGDPNDAQTALQQAAAALHRAQLPGFTNHKALEGALQTALDALQAAPQPGVGDQNALAGEIQRALGALQGAQQPGFNNPTGLRAALQRALGVVRQVPGLGKALTGLLPGLFGSETSTDTAGPLAGLRRPCPLFHLTLPPMSVGAWKSLFRLVPHKQPLGVQREIAGVRGRACDVEGVDAVRGHYVPRPGETPWAIADKLVGDGRRERELRACNPARRGPHAPWRIPPSWFQFIRYVGPGPLDPDYRGHVDYRGHDFLDEEDEAGAPVNRRRRRRPGRRRAARRMGPGAMPGAPAVAIANANADNGALGGPGDAPDDDGGDDDGDDTGSLAPWPSPVPVTPGPTLAFPTVGDLVPAVAEALGVPVCSLLHGATVDPGVLYRLEAQLCGWAALHPGQCTCTQGFGAADVDGVVDQRTTDCLAAWQRWHNARGGSPTLTPNGILTPDAAAALNAWWEAEGHEAVDALLQRGGGRPATQPRPARGPADRPPRIAAPRPGGPGAPGAPQGDLGWTAAQAQRAATEAALLAAEAAQAAKAGGTPDLHAAAAAAQAAAESAADEARRTVGAAEQAAQQASTAPQAGTAPQGQPAPEPHGPPPAPVKKMKKTSGDLFPVAALATVLGVLA